MELIFILLPTFIHSWLMGNLSDTPEDKDLKTFEIGVNFFNKGELAKAFRYFKTQENLHKKSAILYFYLGKCHFEFENYEAALIDFDKALRLETTIKEFYYFKAICHYYLEEWETAQFQLKKALRFYNEKNDKLTELLTEVSLRNNFNLTLNVA